jgi:hypothetical protein
MNIFELTKILKEANSNLSREVKSKISSYDFAIERTNNQ